MLNHAERRKSNCPDEAAQEIPTQHHCSGSSNATFNRLSGYENEGLARETSPTIRHAPFLPGEAS